MLGAGIGERGAGEAIDAILVPANRSDGPGCVVAIARDGDVIHRRGYGLASIEHGVANAPATRMRIGSSSKQFTCLAVMLLAEDGLLDPDAPLDRYLEGLPGFPTAPTARQLMQHTGGLRDHLDASSIANGEAALPAGWAERSVMRQTGANFAPGLGQTYCNAGYHLLSLLVERVSGVPFESFLRARILEPLGMLDTDSAPSDMAITPRLATLHVPRPDGGWRRGIFPSEEIRGEGALVSTVDDLLRWLAHLRGPKVVGTDETWRQMLEPAILPDGSRSIYALGLHRHEHRGVEIIHHAGAVIGGSAQMLTAPAHALDIVMISNGGPLSPAPTVLRLLEAVLADELAPAGPELATLERWKHLDGAFYGDDAGLVIGFGGAGEHLGMSLMGSPAYPVLRDTGDLLRAGFEEVALGPIKIPTADLSLGEDGRAPVAIRAWESGVEHRLTRLDVDGSGARSAADALAGHYRSADLAAEAVVATDGAEPSIAIQGEFGRFAGTLRFLSDWVALAHEPGSPVSAGVVSLLRKDGRVSGFRISMARGRGFRFDRAE